MSSDRNRAYILEPNVRVDSGYARCRLCDKGIDIKIYTKIWFDAVHVIDVHSQNVTSVYLLVLSRSDESLCGRIGYRADRASDTRSV